MIGAKRGGAGGRGVTSWFLATRGIVTVGMTEAEYLALSEVLLEELFVRQMQEFMVPELESRLYHEGRSRSSNTN